MRKAGHREADHIWRSQQEVRREDEELIQKAAVKLKQYG